MQQSRKGTAVATYVLVHGAWQGGWCWQRVVPLLRNRGHDVFTPTLTGLGERAHLLRSDIDVDTQVRDILGVLDYEDLREVVLVGHSYGGMVVEEVAQRAAGRLAQLVHLDSWFPLEDHHSMAELERALMPDFWSSLEELIRTESGGWRLPVPPGDNPMGLPDEADARWVTAKLTPHPARTLDQRLPPSEADAASLPRSYILCPYLGEPATLAAFAEHARSDGWPYREVPVGHEAMVTAPGDLVDDLLALSERTP